MRRVLIANRGEIARRIMRTAHAMGLQTVAVFTEADRRMPFVAEADQAFRISSYLDGEEIVAAAQRVGADAVHPGYGFLSEDVEFAVKCINCMLTWVGPLPRSIAHMGSKLRARRLAQAAGVPVLPATEEVAGADGVGFPLLVKASAGGGGRGMRLVERGADLVEAVASAQREATAAFGDDTVYLERYWPGARHIEVQVAADHHGHLVHLFERECSIQRRHQKLIEEAPAPGLSAELRERLYACGLQVVRAMDHDYVSLGTVEFLVKDDEIAFLEMNTRLQVEHPVTEAITGLDLVRLQLEIACGQPLPFSQEDVKQRGHAVEARLYAEDPAHDFLPSIGRMYRFVHGDEVRWDSGIEPGVEISSEYDGLLAKAIAHGLTRDEAIARLSRGLRGLQVHGIETNRDALVAILEHGTFRTAQASTDFLERHTEVLTRCVPDEVRRRHALAVSLVLRHRRRAFAKVLRFVPPGWRNVPTSQRDEQFVLGGISHEHVDLETDGVQLRYWVQSYGDEHYVNTVDTQTRVDIPPRFARAEDAGAAVGPVAPLPGTVRAVLVEPGQRVTRGQTLVVLDAMKIEHRITAETDAEIAEVRVQAGDKVDAHQLLVVLHQ